MCGRYVTGSDELTWREWAELFDLRLDDFSPPSSSGDGLLLLPTDQAPVAIAEEDDRRLTMMQWGMVPSWGEGPTAGRKMFNLRSETIHRRFTSSFEKRRCLIPATAFFAYSGPKGKRTPHLVRATGPMFAMAGVWATWGDDDFRSATILTRPSVGALAEIHPRSPCVLEIDDARAWLDIETEHDELHALLARPTKLTLQAA